MWWDPNIDMEVSIYIYILIYCTYRVGSKHWIDYEQTCLWWTGWYVYHPASDEESSWSCDKLNNKPPILEGQNRTISGNIIYIYGLVYGIGFITSYITIPNTAWVWISKIVWGKSQHLLVDNDPLLHNDPVNDASLHKFCIIWHLFL